MRNRSKLLCGERITMCEWLKDDVLFECDECKEKAKFQQTDDLKECNTRITDCIYLDHLDSSTCLKCEESTKPTVNKEKCIQFSDNCLYVNDSQNDQCSICKENFQLTENSKLCGPIINYCNVLKNDPYTQCHQCDSGS